MSYEPNIESAMAVSKEVKHIKSLCKDAYYVNENNAQIELQSITKENVDEKALCYVKGLCTTIEKEETPVIVDQNLLTFQFLNDIKDKTQQVEELTAYTRGVLQDMDNEINRLKDQISIVQQAKSLPVKKKRAVRPEHLKQAKERFHYMKTELHSLIQSVFPKCTDKVMDFLGQLMQESMNETSSGYCEVSREYMGVIEILKDMNIVKENPYNNMEVKLAY